MLVARCPIYAARRQNVGPGQEAQGPFSGRCSQGPMRGSCSREGQLISFLELELWPPGTQEETQLPDCPIDSMVRYEVVNI